MRLRAALLLVAFDHFFGNLEFFLRGQELDFADLLEIHADGVVELDVGVVDVFQILIGDVDALVLNRLHLAERRVIEFGGSDEIEHVRHIDFHASRFENVIEFFGLLFGRVHGVERLDQLL